MLPVSLPVSLPLALAPRPSIHPCIHPSINSNASTPTARHPHPSCSPSLVSGIVRPIQFTRRVAHVPPSPPAVLHSPPAVRADARHRHHHHDDAAANLASAPIQSTPGRFPYRSLCAIAGLTCRLSLGGQSPTRLRSCPSDPPRNLPRPPCTSTSTSTSTS